MYLKSLTLKGFKSFADKSVLSLEPGITAIVGPNGSGKSNISDAVLWVLGERNAKNLRGQAMEDVIFAGSSARRAVGVAEVELVLDNSDGTLPIDYNDVVVARRMYRSGESEYLINGTVARRMDVLDILHDSGLGTGTHSIISQGSLDSILRSKPEDRRALIEEAAGVLKHKQRMEKSSRKLEKMSNHVARVRDVVNEVQRQLGPLERKAKKARTYAELSGERDRANLVLAVDDLRRLQTQWGKLQEDQAKAEADVALKREAIEATEAQVEALQDRIRVENMDAGEISRKHRDASSAAERLDSTVLVMRDRRRAALARAEEIQMTIDSSGNERAKQEAELVSTRASFSEANAAKTTAQANVNALSESLGSMRERIAELDRATKQNIQEREHLEHEIDELRVKQVQRQEALTNGLAHIKVIESHMVELELQVSRCTSDAKAAEAEAQAKEEALSTLNEQEAAARSLVGSCTQAREITHRALDEAQSAERSIAAQIEALEEIERQAAISGGEARTWIAQHQESLGQPVSPVSHAIKASPEVEGLVEMFLGTDMSALLIHGDAATTEIARALKQADVAGEVTLIERIDGSKSRTLSARSRSFAGPSGTYPLISKLEIDPEDAEALTALLGDVVVCPSLEVALQAHEQDASGLCFVVPDGSIVWPQGKITLGAALVEEDQGTLARLRHIDELKSTLLAAHETSAKAKAEAEKAEEALRAAQRESLDLSEQLALLKGSAQASRNQAIAASDKLGAATRELEDVQRQKEESQNTIDKARPEFEQAERRLSELTETLEEARKQQQLSLGELQPLRTRFDELTKELSDARMELTKLVERVTYSERVIARHVDDLERLAATNVEAVELLHVKRTAAARLEPLLSIFEELARLVRERARKLEDESAEAQSSSAGLHAKISELRQVTHEKHQAFDEANDKLSAIKVDGARLEMQVEAAVSVIVDDCKVPLDIALTEPELEDRATVEEEAFKLNRRLANLGTINPDAAQEYDELKERYDYLAGQLGDLDSATRSLSRINRMIESRIKDDFATTFETVNQNFQEVFSSLFPGGKANLVLDMPDDIENTGVEVNAQPAGKRITKMSLMSGGEKSLTALALLFALYRTRSTPFYILDEVEAALDDTNLRRLVAFIDAMRDYTQLIMITHQRRTMETADVLFGVSMQADGVTKVISQKLEHALKHAE